VRYYFKKESTSYIINLTGILLFVRAVRSRPSHASIHHGYGLSIIVQSWFPTVFMGNFQLIPIRKTR